MPYICENRESARRIGLEIIEYEKNLKQTIEKNLQNIDNLYGGAIYEQ